MGLFTSEISTKQMVPLCRQLATSFDAGIPIIRTFEQVSENARDPKVKRVILSMTDDLKQGSTLGAAALSQSKFLSPFFIQLLASGERGGRLDVMLRDLAQYFEDRLAMRRQIVGSMTLPGIYLVMAWFLGSFAFGIMRVIREGLAGTGGGVQGVEDYFYEYLGFQAKALVVFAGIFAVIVVLSRLGIFGWISGAVTTFIWPLAPVTRKFALSRFFRSFSLLLGSGLSITKCIEGSAAVMSNPYIEKDFLKAIPQVLSGATLCESLNHSRHMSPLAREMLRVGEETGNLEAQMQKISQLHLEEATHAVDVATKVFAQLLMLAVGILIGYLVISFYANLYGGFMDEMGI